MTPTGRRATPRDDGKRGAANGDGNGQEAFHDVGHMSSVRLERRVRPPAK
jgi:hypothetical protein